MVMSLENNIDVILVKYGSELCTEDHTVCVGMVKTCSVNILMDSNHTPLSVRVGSYGLGNGLFVLGYVVIVCVEDEEKSVAV